VSEANLDPLPAAAVTQKFACLGISGSGKTYGAGKFVECLLDASFQVVVVDTIGNWGQGLRLAADGKSPGIAVPILGGEHGDVPLDAEHGELAAQTVVETRIPLVLDVSDFTKGELSRFVTRFATELLALKKRQKSPVMVVWEECQDIVPQMVRGDKAHMVGAVEALIKKGRNYGVGTLLISQRAAAVNKDVLNQIETLFAFRQNSKHDRLAVRDWIVSQALDVENLAEQLPTLKTGECFCWSPSWLSVLKKIKFGKKRTFDASRTPDAGDYVAPGKLAPVNLDAFKASMHEAVERAKAEDPKALRARIAELEQQLETMPAAEPEQVEVPVLTEEQIARLERAAEGLQKHGIEAVEAARDLIGALPPRELLDGGYVGARRPLVPISAHPAPVTKPKPAESSHISAPTSAHLRPVTKSAAAVTGGELAILTAVAQHRAGCTREQLTVLTGYKRSSRDTYIQRLRAAGRIDADGDRLVVTERGRADLGPDFKPLPKGAALRQYWVDKLSGGERIIFEQLLKAYPKTLTRTELSERTEYQRSSRDTYLQRLSARKLIETKGGGVVASAELF
jgi:hypothetical protein